MKSLTLDPERHRRRRPQQCEPGYSAPTRSFCSSARWAACGWTYPASFFARGPEVALLNEAPGAGIGFIEAHGLALIIAILLWRAAPLRSWHLTAFAVHILLGTANLVFWQFFIVSDTLLAGYVTTSLHWVFATLQLAAFVSAGRPVALRA